MRKSRIGNGEGKRGRHEVGNIRPWLAQGNGWEPGKCRRKLQGWNCLWLHLPGCVVLWFAQCLFGQGQSFGFADVEPLCPVERIALYDGL